MKPINHRFTNVTLNAPAGQEDEILPLRVWTDGEQCISCWQMGWRERLSALVFGRVWLSVLSGRTQPPVWLMATRDALKYEDTGDEDVKRMAGWLTLLRFRTSRLFSR